MLQLCRRDWAAMRTFSKAVTLGRMLVIWYERAMPLREMRSGESPVMSSPLNSIRPEVGRRIPVRQLKKVLFPAPFGPMIARSSPRPTSELTLLSAAKPPKRTVNISVRSIGEDTAAVAPPSAGGGAQADGGCWLTLGWGDF